MWLDSILKFRFIAVLSLLTTLTWVTTAEDSFDWGFFAHKRINRLAVFTLPQEMLALYKPGIEFITEHAVDPDKRRYATEFEAVRHYIDIDHWGVYPFDNVPKSFEEALATFSEVAAIKSVGDTIWATWEKTDMGLRLNSKNEGLKKIRFIDFMEFFQDNIIPNYYEGPQFEADGLERFMGDAKFEKILVFDRFSQHGILPYNLVDYQEKLTNSFRNKDVDRILRYSTEIGHYIGDAHVPLHTTTNYNGQLTDQVGIHGFWESRIPELFADEQYDYLVGKAEVIDDIPAFYWSIVLASNALVDSVLSIEKRLSETFPKDKQYCYEDRNFRNIQQPCPEYAEAYSDALNGMVEKRFRASIKAIGSSWYTAWHHAGRPDLSEFSEILQPASQDTFPSPSTTKIYGRQHWD